MAQSLAFWFWAFLIVSAILSLIGWRSRSWQALFPAAALSLWCGMATFFSIGLFVLPLTASQLGLMSVLLYQHARADRT